jgi:hypothetical protein
MGAGHVPGGEMNRGQREEQARATPTYRRETLSQQIYKEIMKDQEPRVIL